MTEFSLTMELSFLLFFHGNYCNTVRQRLDSERPRILNLEFSSVKVWNFLCLNLDEKTFKMKERCVSSIIRCFMPRLSLISTKKSSWIF